MIALGHEELEALPALSAGDRVRCDRCGEEHTVLALAASEPTERTPISALQKAPAASGDVFVVPSASGCHKPCQSCLAAGSVPDVAHCNGFPWCCPRQHQHGFYLCAACGISRHENQIHNIDRADGRYIEHACPSCREPMKPDPWHPAHTQLFGKERRAGRTLNILVMRCGDDTHVVGLNGRRLPSHAAPLAPDPKTPCQEPSR